MPFFASMRYLKQRAPCHSRLRPARSQARSWRPFYSTRSAATARPVPAAISSSLSLESFRKQAFSAEKPLLIKKSGHGASGIALPAATRWFEFGAGPGPGGGGGGGGDEGSSCTRARLSAYAQDSFSMANAPYELMLPRRSSGRAIKDFVSWLQHSGGGETASARIRPGLAELLAHHITVEGGSSPDQQQRLVRFEAPFALLMAAVEFNQFNQGCIYDDDDTSQQHRAPLTQLYIAQAALSDLPTAMQADVPPPELVRKAGRGDVYAASLWLGLEPTYTPWHRDPNPNLFVQLCSRKTVRVMPPKAGERIFQTVQTELMKLRDGRRSLSSRIRGEEMMQGPERELLHEAVWGTAATASESTLQEAELETGDALFIPKGWWHSVRSVYADGRLNGSVNWWFR